MKLLLTKKSPSDRFFRRVHVFQVRKSGYLTRVPRRFQGQLETGLAKQALAALTSDPAANWIEFAFGGDQFRASLV